MGLRLTTLLAAIALPGAAALAATFCVDTSTELQNALMSASNNGQNDTIRVETGVYTQASGSVAFAYSGQENFSLTIEGGYITLGMIACALQVADPQDTVLSGSDVRTVMQLTGAAGTSGDLTVRNLTFTDGLNPTESGGGLRIGGGAGFIGDILVDRVYFDRNVAAAFGGGLAGGSDGGTFTLRNSLFRGNQAGASHGAASLTNNIAGTANYSAFVGNNTFVENGCTPAAPPTCTVGGVRLGGTSRHAVFNNAFALNSGIDLQFSVTGDLFNNNVPTLSGSPITMSGNLNLSSPGFVNAGAANFRLQFTSPLRNAGTAGFDVGNVDFEGSRRLNDGQFDMGAYENSEILLKDGFEALQ